MASKRQHREKAWRKEEVFEMWPQAAGELRGFKRALEAKSAITAAQLSMALQLAEAEFKNLKRGGVMKKRVGVRAELIVDTSKLPQLQPRNTHTGVITSLCCRTRNPGGGGLLSCICSGTCKCRCMFCKCRSKYAR